MDHNSVKTLTSIRLSLQALDTPMKELLALPETLCKLELTCLSQ